MREHARIGNSLLGSRKTQMARNSANPNSLNKPSMRFENLFIFGTMLKCEGLNQCFSYFPELFVCLERAIRIVEFFV